MSGRAGSVAFTVAGVLAAAALTPSGASSAPSMSRGEQTLPIGYAACMQRARGVFESLGWSNIGAGGAYTSAFKGGEGAYITCNELAPGRVLVNVFVASDSQDSGVPGSARQQLQAAMGGEAPRPPPAPAACGWVDGYDQRVTGDIGRGVTDPAPHRNYVLSTGAGALPGLVSNRLTILQGCMSREAYARLYADVSVLLAGVGRARLGWIDGQDPRAGADPGRGVADRQAHYAYVASGGGGVPSLVAARVAAIDAAVSLDVAAQLYADLSVLIARHALGRQGRTS